MSHTFESQLDFVAEVTGHHPLCVHLVGQQLAEVLRDKGFTGGDTEFLLILTDALTSGVCAGDTIAELIEQALVDAR